MFTRSILISICFYFHRFIYRSLHTDHEYLENPVIIFPGWIQSKKRLYNGKVSQNHGNMLQDFHMHMKI